MNLYLIGPRGSGKTTVARHVARRLDLPLFASDEWIQAQTGRTISQLFAERGEEPFRELEQAAVEQSTRLPAAVVDLGGGAVLRDANRRRIREHGWVVWLFASPEVLWERVTADRQSGNTRPPLTELDGLDEMRSIVAQRQSIYADCADYEIDTEAISPDEVARRVVAWFATVDKRNSRAAARE
jgi:shikimate kinase